MSAVGEKETRSTLLAGGQPLHSPHHAHATMPELEQVFDQGGGGVLVLDSYLFDAKVLAAGNQPVRNRMLAKEGPGGSGRP